MAENVYLPRLGQTMKEGTLVQWLKKGGVKIEISDVQTGPYKLYPTIVYSDKTTDNGEKMYQHAAAIPEKICIIRCNVGTE